MDQRRCRAERGEYAHGRRGQGVGPDVVIIRAGQRAGWRSRIDQRDLVAVTCEQQRRRDPDNAGSGDREIDRVPGHVSGDHASSGVSPNRPQARRISARFTGGIMSNATIAASRSTGTNGRRDAKT